jgi:1,4-alpha-glucan branching enzyme
VGDTDIAVLGRNTRAGLQIWSTQHGYPGDFDYRELKRRDGISGLRYWRVTGSKIDLTARDWYHPDWAEGKISLHADHFARIVEDILREYSERTGQYGVVTAMVDASLFGNWWFEGVRWLGELLARIARSETVDLCTAGAYVEANPPTEAITLPESSWGMAGHHFTWDNVDTHWMWPIVHAAEDRMESLAARYPRAEGDLYDVLSQAAREVLLLQSSDWPSLITTGQAAEYGHERFREHAERFERLATIAERGMVDEAGRRLAAELWERDRIFADIDYRDWAPRAASAPYSLRGSSITAGHGSSRPETSGSPPGAAEWTSGQATSSESVPQWSASGS